MVVPFCSRAEIGFAARCAEIVRQQRNASFKRKSNDKRKKDPAAKSLKAEVAALDQLKKKWKNFPKLKLQYVVYGLCCADYGRAVPLRPSCG